MKKNTKKKEKASTIKTIFMGTGSFATPILSALLDEGYNVTAVYTKVEGKIGRKDGMKERVKAHSPIVAIAKQHKIVIRQPSKFDDDTIAIFRKSAPDLVIVASYGKILPKEIVAYPTLGVVNVHASLLPKFRGPSPIQNAILMGNKKSGITLMLMDEGIDTGAMIAQRSMPIGKDDLVGAVYKKLSSLGANFLIETLPRFIAREITPQPQNDRSATLCQIIDREDGHVQWHDEALMIYNRYRALTPWPGIFSFWKRKDGSLLRLKFGTIKPLRYTSGVARKIGEVFAIDDMIGVQTFSDVIILENIQREGKKQLSSKDFLNGHPDFIGAILR